MNIKQAQEIAQTGALKAELGDRRPEMILDTGRSIGYLEAVEKIECLVEALDSLLGDDCNCKGTEGDRFLCSMHVASLALAKWSEIR